VERYDNDTVMSALFQTPAMREYMRGLSAKAADARKAIPKRKRISIAKKAARARWEKHGANAAT
jgi:hypothetical protein